VTPLLHQPIFAGSPYANELGFTADQFKGYLWDAGDGAITISLVHSLQEGKGNFSRFVRGLLEKGKIVKVPTPLGHMESILMHLGFTETEEYDSILGEFVAIWVMLPEKESVR